jgi:glycosyltransferase 2 family protein
MAGALALQTVLLAGRWRMLLNLRNITLPFSDGLSLTMIGLAFSVALPGAVAGDVVKGYYLNRARGGSRTTVASSIIVDRMLALFGLFLIASIGSMLSYRTLCGDGRTRALWVTIIAALVAMALTGALVAKVNWTQLQSLSGRFASLLAAGQEMQRYLSSGSALAAVISITLAAHALSLIAYEFAIYCVDGTWLAWRPLLVIVPLGLVSTAIPISPAGLGVGSAAFLFLFRLVLPQRAVSGAEAIAVFQVVLIAFCLLGLIPYISMSGRWTPSADAPVAS